jgi:hypothetical protein
MVLGYFLNMAFWPSLSLSPYLSVLSSDHRTSAFHRHRCPRGACRWIAHEPRRWGAYPLAGELRDRAFLVAGLDGTHACQFLAQLFCLVRRHLRPYRRRHHQTHCHCEWSLGCHKLHLCLLGSRTYFWRVLQTSCIASHRPIGFAVCRQLHTASAGLFNHRLS